LRDLRDRVKDKERRAQEDFERRVKMLQDSHEEQEREILRHLEEQ